MDFLPTRANPAMGSARAGHRFSSPACWCAVTAVPGRRLQVLVVAKALSSGGQTRGLVTVATALALLIQGLTLRPLVLALRVPEDTTVEREVQHARFAIAQSALAVLADEAGEEADMLRAKLQAESQSVAAEDNSGSFLSSTALRTKILAARRSRLLAMRRDGVIGDEAFHQVKEELDFADLASSQYGTAISLNVRRPEQAKQTQL